MKLEQEQEIYCKKLVYKTPFPNGNSFKSTIILGVIVSEDSDFISFRTARRTYRISKKCVLSIEDTDQPFRGGVVDDKK